MAIRFQHVLLKTIFPLLLTAATPALAQKVDKPVSGDADSIDNEYFEVGVFSGIINIQEFTSEFVLGANVSFKATEDFFLQFSYLQTDVDRSTYEIDGGGLVSYFGGDDRSYTHYDFLVGYNIFQAEFFFREGKANLATLYVVGGVGDTKFGGEASFTYTTGIGYEVSFARRFVARLDYRDYRYTSTVVDERDVNFTNGLLSFGLGYMF